MTKKLSFKIILFTYCFVIPLLAISSTARASIITYDLTGMLDSAVGTHASGTAFTGSFSYDTVANPDTFASPLVGQYNALSVSLTIGSETVTSVGGLILIENQVNGGDRLTASGSTNGMLGGIFNPIVRWNLRANGGLTSTVFSDDSLPEYLLDPADFTDNPRLLVFGAGSFGTGLYDTLHGSISAVPAPTAIWLFGAGLIGLIGFIRRRKAA